MAKGALSLLGLGLPVLASDTFAAPESLSPKSPPAGENIPGLDSFPRGAKRQISDIQGCLPGPVQLQSLFGSWKWSIGLQSVQRSCLKPKGGQVELEQTVMGRGSPLSPQLLLLGPAAELMDTWFTGTGEPLAGSPSLRPGRLRGGEAGRGWKVTGGQQFLSWPW